MSMVLTNKDFDKICRTCLEARENMTSLFISEILNMLETCTTIVIKENDGLPHNICSNCINKINDIYSFKTKCEQSDRLLHKILKESIKNENLQDTEHLDVKNQTENYENYITLVKLKNDVDLSYNWYEDNSKSNHSETNNDNNYDNLDNLKIKKETVEQTDIEQKTQEECNPDTFSSSSDSKSKFKDKEKEKEVDADSNSAKTDSDDNSCDDDDNNDEDNFNTFGFETSNMIQETLDQKDVEKRKRREHYNSIREKFFNSTNCNLDTLTCNLCNKNVANMFSLVRHMETHDQDRQFQFFCDVCNKGFYEKGQLTKHKRRHLGETRYKCDKCSKQYYEPSALAVHLRRRHRTEPTHSCTLCDKKFMIKIQLEMHMKTHKPREETCTECGIKTVYLRQHMFTHMKDRQFPCQLCDKTFKVIDALKTHHRRCHVEQEKVDCDICGKTLTSKYMQKHLAVHRDDKSFRCSMCSKLFRTLSDLYVHRKKVHNNELAKEKRVLCNMCGIQTHTEADLRIHMRTHTGEKPFACNHCDKRYRVKSALNKHMRRHTGERPFQCTMCEKRFFDKNVLKHHTMTHTGEKPYTCYICEKSFIQNVQLKTHMKVHTKD